MSPTIRVQSPARIPRRFASPYTNPRARIQPATNQHGRTNKGYQCCDPQPAKVAIAIGLPSDTPAEMPSRKPRPRPSPAEQPQPFAPIAAQHS